MSNIDDNCVPYANIPYNQQLINKKIINDSYFEDLVDTIDLPDVFESPEIYSYRNKLRFDIGYDNNNIIQIGYTLTKKECKNRYIYPAKNMIHVSKKMFRIIEILEKYFNNIWVENNYDSKIYSQVTRNGQWKSINIRTSFNLDYSLLIFNLENLTYSELMSDNWISLTNSLKNYMSSFDNNINITYYLIRENKSINIYGNNYIHEKLDKFIFKISPKSFFQVNTYATEKLYNLVLQLSTKYSTYDKQYNNILFDICCGTGTIGIYLSQLFDKVIGIEICESSVNDANYNKILNSVDNIEFICSPVQNILSDKINELNISLTKNKYFVILDPPRSGLHDTVLNTLINVDNLDTIIYVSCNVITLKKNLKILENKYKIVELMYIDLFPHTEHCEIITVLRNIDSY
jgi:23S rRNA (uracil-5-)-methyltransferase RumA